jgi:hypothetical protein
MTLDIPDLERRAARSLGEYRVQAAEEWSVAAVAEAIRSFGRAQAFSLLAIDPAKL